METRNEQQLDELIGKVDDVIAWQRRHVNEEHVNLATAVAENKALLARIVDLLDGEDVYSDLDKVRIIDHKPGLISEIEQLRKQSQNGGIPAKLKMTTGQRTLVVTTMGLLTAIVVLLTAIVEHLT